MQAIKQKGEELMRRCRLYALVFLVLSHASRVYEAFLGYRTPTQAW